FADAAARYFEESQHLRSADVTAWHIRLLTPYIGALELNRIHDQTLERFIADRRAEGVTATTINRSLEVVRTILNRAARSYRDANGEGVQHPIWVFPYRNRHVATMNNTAWQRARREAGLCAVRIHDLRHTVACRLRAVGVSMEDREVLLGHANHS